NLLNLRGHTKSVGRCAISNDGNFGITASNDTTAIVWDLSQNKEYRKLRTYNGAAMKAASLSYDGSYALTASKPSPRGKTLLLWNVTQGDILRELNNTHIKQIRCCKLSDDGSMALTASLDGTANVWRSILNQNSTPTSTKLSHPCPSSHGLIECALSVSKSLGLTVCSCGVCCVWDLRDKGKVMSFLDTSDGSGATFGCGLSGDGEVVFVWKYV
ncbi:hypothetical protein AAMO2058_001735300, partial [Amorphochlora amoebiformis]